jgi:hypothetical protein
MYLEIEGSKQEFPYSPFMAAKTLVFPFLLLGTLFLPLLLVKLLERRSQIDWKSAERF